MLQSVLLAVCVVGGTGIFIGLFLGFAGKKFYVDVDEKEELILDALPGNNCGGCGYPGCSGLAHAIFEGEAPVNACPVGGADVAERIGEIMGVEAEVAERKIAFVKCAGTFDDEKEVYDYYGLEDCQQMKYVQGAGPLACSHGCYGYGSCVKVCQFDAIHVINGVAVVDRKMCKACGLCVSICPQHLIELIPDKIKWEVRCANTDKGKAVTEACDAGCIGCGLCIKECKFDAIHMENNYPVIDMDKCKSCGACARKCPRHTIRLVKDGLPPAIKKKPVKSETEIKTDAAIAKVEAAAKMAEAAAAKAEAAATKTEEAVARLEEVTSKLEG